MRYKTVYKGVIFVQIFVNSIERLSRFILRHPVVLLGRLIVIFIMVVVLPALFKLHVLQYSTIQFSL